MRKSIFLAVLVCLHACTSNKKTLSKGKRNDFLMHLNILDSAANVHTGDIIPCCSGSIAFMVENTDVKISAEGTHYGFLFFTKPELKKWHEYYKRNILKKE